MTTDEAAKSVSTGTTVPPPSEVSVARWMRAWPAVACVVLASFTPCQAHADEILRHPPDADDLMWMHKRQPEAAKAFEEGEHLFANAKSEKDIEQAVQLLKEATEGAPDSSLAPRRLCQAYTALGRHADAVKTCEKALYNNSTLFAVRALVGAYMSGPYQPTPSELGYAKMFARRAEMVMPKGPWHLAAECDIAVKLGDPDMFNECSDRLKATFPDYYETDRVRAVERSWRPGWGVMAAWAAVVLSALGTLVHAIVRARRGKTLAAKTGTVAFGVALLLSAYPRAALADTDVVDAPAPAASAPKGSLSVSKFAINDADPSSSVPSPEERDKDPMNYGYFIMDLSARANAAIVRGDHAAAVRYFEAVIKTVPEMALGYRQACVEYQTLGQTAKALEACAGALSGEGSTLADYSEYGKVVFAQKGELPKKELGNLDSVIAHLKSLPEGRAVGLDIECELGTRLADVKRLELCAPALAAINAEDPKSIFYSWTLAMHHGDLGSAKKLADHAMSRAGLPAEVQRAQGMQKATLDATPLWRKGFGFRDWRVGLLAILILASVLTFLLSRKSPEPGTPAPGPPQA